MALALGAAVLVLGPLDVGRDNLPYIFLPSLCTLMPLASDRLAALIVAAGLMLLFVFLEILTIGVYFLPAAGAMAVAAVVRSSGGQVDVVTEAEYIRAALAARGRQDAAQRINDAIAGGATGTEILSRLHSTLGELLASRELADREMRRRARDLRRTIGYRLRS